MSSTLTGDFWMHSPRGWILAWSFRPLISVFDLYLWSLSLTIYLSLTFDLWCHLWPLIFVFDLCFVFDLFFSVWLMFFRFPIMHANQVLLRTTTQFWNVLSRKSLYALLYLLLNSPLPFTGMLLGILFHTWLRLTISALRLIRPTELRPLRVFRLFPQKLTSIFAAISRVYIQLLGKDIYVVILDKLSHL